MIRIDMTTSRDTSFKKRCRMGSRNLKKGDRLFIPFTVVAATLLFFTLSCEAGGLTGSLERALGKKLGNQTTNVLRRKSSSASIAATEKSVLRQQLSSLDAKTLKLIEQRYGIHIPKERLMRSTQVPTLFLDEKPVVERGRYGGSHIVRGETSGKSPRQSHVYSLQQEVMNTTAHERLHNLSDLRFRKELGKNMDEGVTQFFSESINHSLNLTNIKSRTGAGVSSIETIYGRQYQVARLMALRVGKKPLAKAYFGGNISALRKAIDSHLGRGSFDKVVLHMKNNHLDLARSVLIGKR